VHRRLPGGVHLLLAERHVYRVLSVLGHRELTVVLLLLLGVVVGHFKCKGLRGFRLGSCRRDYAGLTELEAVGMVLNKVLSWGLCDHLVGI